MDPEKEKELDEYLLTSAKVGYSKARRQIKHIAEGIATEEALEKEQHKLERERKKKEAVECKESVQGKG